MRSGIVPPHLLAALRRHPEVVVRDSVRRTLAAAYSLAGDPTLGMVTPVE